MKKTYNFFVLLLSILLSFALYSCSNGVHEHSYEETIVKEPTCTNVGRIEKKCSCGDVIYDVIPTNNHIYESCFTPGTCKEKGMNYEKCCNCGDVINVEYTDYADHVYIENSTTPATCSMGEIHNMICTVCGMTTRIKDDLLDKNAHSYTKQIIQPTCMEEGYDLYVCSLCEDEYVDNYTDKTKHSVLQHDAQPATCTNIGWTAYETCKNCEFSTYKEIPMQEHTPQSAVIENVIVATCVENGAHDEVVYCKDCNTELSRINLVDLKVEHSTYKTIVPPSCETKGYTLIECENCSDTITEDSLPSLGHNIVHYEKKEVNCTEVGYDAYEACSRCEYSTFKEISALGHHLVYVAKQNATCEFAGNEAGHNCSRCKYTDGQETIAALGHVSYIENENIVEATCTTDGFWDEVEYCSVCNKELSRNQFVQGTLGHELDIAVEENSVAPTCTKDASWDEVVYCSRCEEELSRERYVDIGSAFGHDSVHYDAKAPTCLEVGWNAYETCSVCDYSTYCEISATGHKTSNKIVSPTCTTQGYTLVTCSNCLYSLETNQITSLGHNYIDYSAKEVTCTEAGWNSYKVCDRCGDSTLTLIPAMGHKENDCVQENIVSPSCEASGQYDKVVYCKECNAELSRDIIYVESLGHDYASLVTLPSCTAKGYTTHTCSRCGKYNVDTYTDMVEHTIIEIPTSYLACGGVEKTSGQKCSVCDEIIVAQETINDHKWVVQSILEEPTCLEKGRNSVKCNECDIEDVSYSLALGHIANAADSHIDPTCEETGCEYYTCTRCNKEYEVELPALGHELITIDGNAATCTKTGLTDGQRCTRCDTLIRSQEVIPATGHDFNDERICINCHVQNYAAKYDIASSGKVTAFLVSDGLYYQLIITGDGTMKNFENLTNSTPWYSYADKINTLIISEEVTSIGSYAFVNLKSSNTLDIYFYAIDCKRTGSRIWSYTSGQEVTIHVGPKVQIINEYFFSSSSTSNGYAVDHSYSLNLNLTRIEFIGQSTCKTIARGAFACVGKKSGGFNVVIPNSVTSICQDAFVYSSLAKVTIGKGVTFIGKKAFSISGLEMSFLSTAKWRRSTTDTPTGDYYDLYNETKPSSYFYGNYYNWYRG